MMEDICKDMMIKLNSLEKTDNPNQIKAKFIVHDFKDSWYGDVITKEVCQENMKMLVGQYICCGYVPREENDGEDALLDHMVTTSINRDTGKEMQTTNTTPIGHITDVYIDFDNETNQEVLYCNAILWIDKFYNVISLLDEWLQKGVPIACSCEYRFSNYTVNDGFTYIQSPIHYKALTILNSEKRGNIEQVYPAYDSSKLCGYEEKFNQAMQKDIDTNAENSINSINNNGKGDKMDNMFLTALNDISFGETREKIMSALSKVMVADEYNRLWISQWDVYDTYFIYETYNGEEWIRFKVDYTKSETDEIEVNYEERKQVVRQDVYVEVSEMETSLNAIKSEKEEAETKLNSIIEEKTVLENSLLESKNAQVELSTTIESLNSKIEELEAFKVELDEIKYNERLEDAKSTYKDEFVTFNGVDKFETDEVQALIVDTLKDETSFNAIIKLKDILLECAKENKPEVESFNSVETNVVETSVKVEGKVPSKESFKKYGLNL